MYVPLLLTLGLSVLMSFGAIFSLVWLLDGNAAAQTRATLRGAIESELTAAADGVYENARWDDAVRHLYGSLDLDWAKANISGISSVYVIDARGGTLFGRRSSGVIDPPLAEAAPDATRALLARLPADYAAALRMRSGISILDRYRGQPTILAAMPILPLEQTLAGPERGLRFMVHVIPIDSAKVRIWRASFRLHDLTLGTTGGETLSLRDGRGRLVGGLSWTPPRPGLQALRTIGPVLLVALAALLGLTYWVFSGLRVQAEALVRTSEARQRAAEQAERARAQAEAARASAEAAAERESAARRQHQQDLSAASRAIGTRLREALASLTDGLLQSAEALDTSADRTVSTIQDQQARMREMQVRAEAASSFVSDIRAQVAHFTESVGQIASAAKVAEQRVESANTRSARGVEISERLVDHLASVERTISAIASIASQTNVLALNATIEAVRGGGSADGFAVVAAEVKALAGRVSALTVEVADQLRTIGNAGRDAAEMSVNVQASLRDVQQSISTTASAAVTQDRASATINLQLASTKEQTDEMKEAINSVARLAEDLASASQATRHISARVRAEAKSLRADINSAIDQLLSA